MSLTTLIKAIKDIMRKDGDAIRDPEELMAEYQQSVHQLEAAQQALKAVLMACPRGKA